MKPGERIIVALDTPDLKQAESLIACLKGTVSFYKVGLELFTAAGWDAVEMVQRAGAKVFLDLKLHDIPNTVSKTVRGLCRRGIDLTTVHTLGGSAMMKAAAETAREFSGNTRCRLLGVTILTSHTEAELAEELGISKPLPQQVSSLAGLAQRSGLDGAVCSPLEIEPLRKSLGKDFLIVTPGIRPEGDAAQDQKRILTPREAISQGADYLVIGRPVTEAPKPEEKAAEILQSLTR